MLLYYIFISKNVNKVHIYSLQSTENPEQNLNCFKKSSRECLVNKGDSIGSLGAPPHQNVDIKGNEERKGVLLHIVMIRIE